MRRRLINGNNPVKSFDDSFEEQTMLIYAYNLINSSYVKTKTRAVYELADYVLSGKASALIEKYTAKYEIETDSEGEIPEKYLMFLLKSDISGMIAERLKKLSGRKQSQLSKRLWMIEGAFDLSREETFVLLFFYLIEADSILSDYLTGEHEIADFSRQNIFYSYGHILIGIEKKGLRNALKNGALYKSLLIQKGHSRSLEISDWCFDLLSGFDSGGLSHIFFYKSGKTGLKTTDFNVSSDNLRMLHNIMNGADGKNILIYGAPGSGKTSFAKAFAAECRRDLFIVKTPESGEHDTRLSWICATLNMADKNDSIVLIDESDEVLNSWESLFFESKTNKSWINSVLDGHNKKVIWIANRIEQIDKSTLRRFNFSLQFNALTSSQRAALLKVELKRRGVKDYLTEKEIGEICSKYTDNVDGIVSALDEIKALKNKSKTTVIKQLRLILENRQNLLGMNKADTVQMQNSHLYTIEGLNCSEDPKKIAGIIKKRIEFCEKESTGGVRALNILLYGLPGTGKTEFVLHLGHLIEKDIILRKASDIQSKWVGETEKNIAGAFREAKQKGGILFFDEADTFLFPRTEANRSWEKSATNEMLAQMDAYSGIAIFATNDIAGLDHAALRRFKFKVEFKPLSSEGVLTFYEKMLVPLLPQNKKLNAEQTRLLKQFTNLTPGDFAVVRDKMLFEERKDINHDMLIHALTQEIKYKRNFGKVIGFGR